MLKNIKIYLSIFFIAGVLSLRTNNKLFLGQQCNAKNATLPTDITIESNITELKICISKVENYVENMISDLSKKGFHYDQEKLKNNSLYYNISIRRLENLIEEGINKTISKLDKFSIKSLASGKCLDNSGRIGGDELNYFFILDCQNKYETQQFTYEIPSSGQTQNTTESTLQTLVLSTNDIVEAENNIVEAANTTVVGKNISKTGFHLLPPENEWVYLKILNFCVQHNGNNNRIIHAPCKNEPAFLWKFNKNSDGTYIITSKTGDRVLDVDGERKDNGTGISLFTKHGGNNQKWNIVPLILSDIL